MFEQMFGDEYAPPIMFVVGVAFILAGIISGADTIVGVAFAVIGIAKVFAAAACLYNS